MRKMLFFVLLAAVISFSFTSLVKKQDKSKVCSAQNWSYNQQQSNAQHAAAVVGILPQTPLTDQQWEEIHCAECGPEYHWKITFNCQVDAKDNK